MAEGISIYAPAGRYGLDLVMSSMHLTIDLPPDISEVLQGRWGDVSRRALEAVAVETYRTGVLSESQIKRLLGFENRLQFHALLKEHRVPYRYSELDLQDDLAAHRELGILSTR
jgi:predicted HTH domain antitoxin